MKIVMEVLIEVHRDAKVSDVEVLKETLVEYLNDFRSDSPIAEGVSISTPKFSFAKN